MTQISPLFSIPHAISQHPGAASLNAALKALFLQRESENDRYANPDPFVARNDALFESRFDLFDWPDAAAQGLRTWCMQQLYGVIGQLNGYERSMLSRLDVASESWFHITRRGGYFALHNHPMASWSGVYCVDDGEDESSPKDSGLLHFPHPDTAATMFIDRAISNMALPYSNGPRSFRLTPGQLLLFPSWLLHEVKPFHGNGTRITVAFNAMFRERPAT